MVDKQADAPRLRWALGLLTAQTVSAAAAYLGLTAQRLGIAACGQNACDNVDAMWRAGDVALGVVGIALSVSFLTVVPVALFGLRARASSAWTIGVVAIPAAGIGVTVITAVAAAAAFQQGLP